eukprot:SAG31_NODE_4439_length_3228_cov_1.409076_6_plen_127_part_00
MTDCYVESHWQSNGFIDGGGQCGTGNCSTANYWILRNNRGGYGADISVASENSVEEGNIAHSCCTDMAKSCGVGAHAGIANAPFVPKVRGYFLAFVQLLEKYVTLIERYTALIEKVSALIGQANLF